MACCLYAHPLEMAPLKFVRWFCSNDFRWVEEPHGNTVFGSDARWDPSIGHHWWLFVFWEICGLWAMFSWRPKWWKWMQITHLQKKIWLHRSAQIGCLISSSQPRIYWKCIVHCITHITYRELLASELKIDHFIMMIIAFVKEMVWAKKPHFAR